MNVIWIVAILALVVLLFWNRVIRLPALSAGTTVVRSSSTTRRRRSSSRRNGTVSYNFRSASPTRAHELDCVNVLVGAAGIQRPRSVSFNAIRQKSED